MAISVIGGATATGTLPVNATSTLVSGFNKNGKCIYAPAAGVAPGRYLVDINSTDPVRTAVTVNNKKIRSKSNHVIVDVKATSPQLQVEAIKNFSLDSMTPTVELSMRNLPNSGWGTQTNQDSYFLLDKDANYEYWSWKNPLGYQNVLRTADGVVWDEYEGSNLTTQTNGISSSKATNAAIKDGTVYVFEQYLTKVFLNPSDFISYPVNTLSTGNILSAKYVNGTFYLATWDGGTSTIIYTSTDGYTWTSAATLDHGTSDWTTSKLSYVNSTFFLTRGPQIWRSTNGTTWALVRTMTTSSQYMWTVAYGNGVYVATGETTAFAYSSDGTTWTQATLPNNPTTVGELRFLNGYFYQTLSDQNIIYSTNGSSWTARTVDWATSYYPKTVHYLTDGNAIVLNFLQYTGTSTATYVGIQHYRGNITSTALHSGNAAGMFPDFEGYASRQFIDSACAYTESGTKRVFSKEGQSFLDKGDGVFRYIPHPVACNPGTGSQGGMQGNAYIYNGVILFFPQTISGGTSYYAYKSSNNGNTWSTVYLIDHYNSVPSYQVYTSSHGLVMAIQGNTSSGATVGAILFDGVAVYQLGSFLTNVQDGFRGFKKISDDFYLMQYISAGNRNYQLINARYQSRVRWDYNNSVIGVGSGAVVDSMIFRNMSNAFTSYGRQGYPLASSAGPGNQNLPWTEFATQTVQKSINFSDKMTIVWARDNNSATYGVVQPYYIYFWNEDSRTWERTMSREETFQWNSTGDYLSQEDSDWARIRIYKWETPAYINIYKLADEVLA